ncbi:MAG: site-specific DNA-methyltransferase [Nannocystaceae bacterium]
MGRGDVELVWPGKYDAEGRRAAIPSPGQRIAPVAAYGDDPSAGLLLHGDNLAAMDALLAAGERVDLGVIDPPFATGDNFSISLPIGEGDAVHRAPAYSDRWEGGVAGFLAMLDPRLRLLHQLLADDGSLYVHLDPTVVHPVKVLLDEIFGPECFQREIIWRIGWVSGFKSRARNWIRNHDTILFYVKDPARFTFNKRYVPYPPGYVRRDGKPPKGKGIPIDDVWNAGPGDLDLRGADSLDSIQIKSFSREKTGWATQKNESLLRRIIDASSRPGDRVADFFCGSGSTLAAAASLGRRWVGCDRAAMAIHLARKRLREAGASFVQATLTRPSAVSSSSGARGSADVAPPVGDASGDAAAEGASTPAIRGDEAHLVGAPEETLSLAVLQAARAHAASRGCASLRIVARRWGFALADAAAAAEEPAVAIACLHWRGDEPALPRPELRVHVRGVEAWTIVVELAGYAHSAPEHLPDPEVCARVQRWDEWLDAWALAFAEAARPFAPVFERGRSRRRRALDLTTEAITIPEAARASTVALRLHLVDILGLETLWPLTLRFTADGALQASEVGVEIAGGVAGFG